MVIRYFGDQTYVEDLTLIGNAAINGTGNSLANHVTGNAQNNTINGGLSADILRGEGGQDSFVFDTALGKGNIDILADFNVAADTILLDNAVFTALPPADLRLLSAAEFRVGSAAMDSTDRASPARCSTTPTASARSPRFTSPTSARR